MKPRRRKNQVNMALADRLGESGEIVIQARQPGGPARVHHHEPAFTQATTVHEAFAVVVHQQGIPALGAGGECIYTVTAGSRETAAHQSIGCGPPGQILVVKGRCERSRASNGGNAPGEPLQCIRVDIYDG